MLINFTLDSCYKYIASGEIRKLLKSWGLKLPEDAVGLVENLLQPASWRRLTAAGILDHHWFRDLDKEKPKVAVNDVAKPVLAKRAQSTEQARAMDTRDNPDNETPQSDMQTLKRLQLPIPRVLAATLQCAESSTLKYDRTLTPFADTGPRAMEVDSDELLQST